MYPDAQRLEDLSSIRGAMRQISQEAQAVVDLLDLRIEDEHLDGWTEAEDVRSILELIQSLTLEVGEELDAYKQRIPAKCERPPDRGQRRGVRVAES